MSSRLDSLYLLAVLLPSGFAESLRPLVRHDRIEGFKQRSFQYVAHDFAREQHRFLAEERERDEDAADEHAASAVLGDQDSGLTRVVRHERKTFVPLATAQGRPTYARDCGANFRSREVLGESPR